MDLPVIEKTQRQLDQEAFEMVQRDLAKAKLYHGVEYYQNAEREDKLLSDKGAREFSASFIGEHLTECANALRKAFSDWETINLDANARSKDLLENVVDRVVTNLDFEKVALIGLSNIMLGLQLGVRPAPPEHKVTRQIGHELDFECFMNYINQLDPDLMDYLSTRNLTDPTTKRHKRISGTIMTIDDFQEVTWDWLSSGEMMRLGHFVRQTIFDQLECFELIKAISAKGHPQYAIVLSDRGVGDLRSIMKAVEKTVGSNFPMIDKPVDWDEQGTGGGWRTPQAYPRNVLVRNSMGTNVSKSAIRAINALQETAWEINTFVFNIQRQLIERNIEIGSFRAFNEELYSKVDNPLIIDPDDLRYSWEDANLTEEEVKKRNMAYAISKRWEEEKSLTSQKAVSPRLVLEMAERLLFTRFGDPEDRPVLHELSTREERLYHMYYVESPGGGPPRQYTEHYDPWYLDNRTRCYPAVDTLNPQGSDYQKALLQYSVGHPKSVQSKKDLLVSIATTYGNGVDKKSFRERILFARSLRELMPTIVTDPLNPISMKFWTKADEPFQFLALCHEYVNVFIKRIWTEHRVSAGRDATCSGIQITGAMLRDTRTCKLVNVTPSPEPQDAYADVAKEAKKLLTSKAPVEGDPEGRTWLQIAVDKREKNRLKRAAKDKAKFEDLVKEGKRKPDQGPPEYTHRSAEETAAAIKENLHLINRSIAKMPTMLIPYGGSFITIYGHVKDKLVDKEATFHSADYTVVTKALIEGMAHSLPAFTEVNAWFQSLAKAVLASPLGEGENYSIQWETPGGSLVIQEYYNPDYKKITSSLGDSVRHYTQREDDEDSLNESKMRTALAANVVHSIDASIIQNAVNRIYDFNQESPDKAFAFTAVHDCIYGPSGSFSVLMDAIRRAFYDGVTNNITEHIAENNLPDEEYRKLVPTLKKGRAKVTIENILKSEYLFS